MWPPTCRASSDELARHAATAADLARALSSERGRRRRHGHAVLGRGHATIGRELSSRHRADRDRDRQRSSAGCRRSRRRLAPLPSRWSSPSSSIRTAGCCRSAISVAEDRLDPQLLRPARLGSAARQFRRHRQGRDSGPALVPAGPRGDAGRTRRGPDLVVGLDVRVSHAVADHAGAARQPDREDQRADRAAADRLWRAASACRGASPSRPTTPATRNSPINIPTSACRAWASSAA